MAEKLVTRIERFIGTAAERAGMTTTSLLVGTEFFEKDTGKLYKWDGAAFREVKTSATLAAGTALAGKFGIDQVTANANEVVTKSGSVTLLASETEHNDPWGV